MSTPILLTSTGDIAIDARLPQVIALFELVFPQRIRAYYLTGSSIDRTAVSIPGDALNSSDIDLAVVFKDRFQAYETDRFKQCRTGCEALGSFHLDQLDASPLCEEDIFRDGHLALKVASYLVCGEDIRAHVPMPALRAYICSAIKLSRDHIAEMRHLEPEQLTLPLTHPDAKGNFFGYDYSDVGYGGRPGTRFLVGSVSWAAAALVAIRAGQMAATKRDAVRMYATYINDAWSPLIEGVYTKCKLQWGYTIPDDTSEQQHSLLKKWF